jgi:hypothetical protein
MAKLDKAKDWFAKYDKSTTKKMAEHNRAGGAVRAPVRSTKGASREDLKDRANFIYRKATQALSQGHPLKDDKGRPTPAALQFKRWAAKVPQNQEDLRELKALGSRLKERYKPKD